MDSKNDISLDNFLDFQIFAPNDQNNESFDSDHSKEKTTLVIYEPVNEHKELETFLTNILKAAKLDISKDVNLLKTTAESGFSFIRLKTKTSIGKVLIFGIPPKKLGINLDLKLYTSLEFQGCIFLLADSLATIQSKVDKKRALWTCLQQIYLT